MVSGREDSKCKGPEVATIMVSGGASGEASVVGAEEESKRREGLMT